jgi:putative nucleotidyltransferase with HDIG domain
MTIEILIIDDEAPVRNLIKQILEQKGYNCTLAADAEEARNYLKKQKFELVLCDMNMPGESGLNFLRDVLPKHKDMVATMVTAVDDLLVAETILEVGIYDYIIKPFDRSGLLISVANSLRRRELEIANRAYQEKLEQMVSERTAKLRKALDGIIHTVALTVETRDLYTAGHQKRVAKLSSAIAKEMGFTEEQVEGIFMAGIIHDLGKISVPAEILSKPTRLTENEFNLIKNHSQVGYNILKDIDFPWPIAQMVLQHHERVDGSGYPQGLSGEEILIEAKILGVADVVEAMSSHRPYRPALGIDKALEEIKKNKGIFYDPRVADVCLKLFSKKGFKFE